MSQAMTRMMSDNFDDRRDGQTPALIIVHYTGTLTSDEARDRFLDANPGDQHGRLSPHYLIDGEGQIIQFVEEEKRAWHGGKGRWKNFTDINSASIGIEIWNTGHEFEFEDFLPLQVEALIGLMGDIRTRWQIEDRNILGHSDTAPGRKIDPGEKFPWATLNEAGIGLMPKVEAEDELLAAQWIDQPDEIVAALHEYGYDPSVDASILIQEFRRHFLPETMGAWGVDTGFCASLASLLRQARR